MTFSPFVQLCFKSLPPQVFQLGIVLYMINCIVFDDVCKIILVKLAANAWYLCALRFFFVVSAPQNIFFQSHWLLSHITITKTMVKDEREMNPVTMTIINPGKPLAVPGIEPVNPLFSSPVCLCLFRVLRYINSISVI